MKNETKAAHIERLMLRPKGATVSEMSKATGWIPHSLTGAISRARRHLNITKTTDPRRGAVYHAEKIAA